MTSALSPTPGGPAGARSGPVSGWAVLAGLACLAVAGLGLAWWLDARRAVSAAGPGPEGVALRLDINRARAEELELLPNVGPTRAARLVEARKARGGFRTLAELDEPGLLGPGASRQLAPHLLPLPPAAPAGSAGREAGR